VIAFRCEKMRNATIFFPILSSRIIGGLSCAVASKLFPPPGPCFTYNFSIQRVLCDLIVDAFSSLNSLPFLKRPPPSWFAGPSRKSLSFAVFCFPYPSFPLADLTYLPNAVQFPLEGLCLNVFSCLLTGHANIFRIPEYRPFSYTPQ